MNKAYLFAGLLLWAPVAVEAAGGLELYSYQDDIGQLIVVDSIERIPVRYRSRALRNFIPTLKSDSSSRKATSADVAKIKNSSDIAGQEASDNGQPIAVYRTNRTNANISESTDSDVEVVEPEEPPDSGLAEADAFVEKMNKVLDNNRQIYNIVLSSKNFTPISKGLHSQNISSLAAGPNPQYIVWKHKHSQKNQWNSAAAKLLDSFKTIQYTITKWMGENPSNLLYGLPPFIETSQSRLNQLKTQLNALKELDKQMIENIKGKKK